MIDSKNESKIQPAQSRKSKNLIFCQYEILSNIKIYIFKLRLTLLHMIYYMHDHN